MKMPSSLSRDTWLQENKYLIRAFAIWRPPLVGSSTCQAVGDVQVYVGNPADDMSNLIFCSKGQSNGYDLLDALQSAERIGRDFISTYR
jgi:hypothetical protein